MYGIAENMAQHKVSTLVSVLFCSTIPCAENTSFLWTLLQTGGWHELRKMVS